MCFSCGSSAKLPDFPVKILFLKVVSFSQHKNLLVGSKNGRRFLEGKIKGRVNIW
jgi:hypothetical protein